MTRPVGSDDEEREYFEPDPERHDVTTLIVDSAHNCPRCGKRMVDEVGPGDDSDGVVRVLVLTYCLHCPYRELNAPSRRKRLNGSTLMERIRDRVRA